MEILAERVQQEMPGVMEETELHSVQFADDCTNVVLTDSEMNMEKVMTVCSEEYHKYFSAQGMKLNPTKEEHIIHAHSTTVRTKPGGVVVNGRQEAAKVKLLGIIVDQNYKFKSHTSSIISKASHRLAHVSKIKDILDDDLLKQTVNAVVMSVINWGIEFVARDHVNLVRLQKIQNYALRIMTRSSWMMSVRKMLQDTKLLNTANQARLIQMSLLRRMMKSGGCPHTSNHIRYPGPRTRSWELTNTFPNQRKHGPKSILVQGLDNLNKMAFWRDRETDGKHRLPHEQNSQSE